MSVQTLILHHDKDGDYATGLRNQLVTRERNGDVVFLKPLLPGELLENSRQRIRESNLILFLVSVDALADPFLGVTLLKESIAHATAGRGILVPIYIRPFDWQDTELRHFMVASASKPISKYDAMDEGCYEATVLLKKLIDDFDNQIKSQKLTFDQQRSLINTFNFREQINNDTRLQLQSSPGWFKVCLLQGSEKSGFNLLAWRIRTELGGLPPNAATTCRAISLDNARDQGPGALTASICRDLLPTPAASMTELVTLLRQHLQNQHIVLYLNHIALVDTQEIAAFFAELSTTWTATRSTDNSPEPTHSFWCFLTYTGETALEVPFDQHVPRFRFPAIKPVESTDFDHWLECCMMDQTRKTELLNKQASIIGNAPDNQVIPVLERLCNRLSLRTMLYEEYVLKLDIP